MNTLRSGISDLVNTLNKLRNNIIDPDQQDKIQKVLRILFMLWEEVIRQDIDATTVKFKTALDALSGAETAAQAAMKDVAQVAKAIASAAKAAKAVDKVVKVVAGVLL